MCIAPALDDAIARRDSDMAMHFMSDNAARVHPAVWRALEAADAPDAPYDGDALSAGLASLLIH